jgi:hypothetical protein
MNTDEMEICELLKSFPGRYVSVADISRRLGSHGRFAQNRNWAAPFMRRMELDGVVESNQFGEYRLKAAAPVTFKSALEKPDISLGDTTIIMLGEPAGAGQKS